MSTVIDRADLYYRDQTSDKVYHATLEENNGSYRVCFSYGRRGQSLLSGIKVDNSTLTSARKVFTKLVNDKKGKGYNDMPASNVRSIPVVEPVRILHGKCSMDWPRKDGWCSLPS